MRLSDFDYELPDELIAQTPLANRSDSRLLVVQRETRSVAHRQFSDLLEYFDPGDLVVMNNTRVTARRLFGTKATGAKVELLLLHEARPGEFECLARPAKRLNLGAKINFHENLSATVVGAKEPGIKVVQFDAHPGRREALASVGETPLPPYIHERLMDQERYQTVYASRGGSAAAPTAGLHFTPQILQALRGKGVEIAEVTLDVSLDTFRPIGTDDVTNHVMHGERCSLSEEAAEQINWAKGRIVAVGTTTVRTLESFATERGKVQSGTTLSRLFIKPGFRFKVVTGMFTNFHLPKTTMLLMICAMADRDLIFHAYAEAVGSRYRFLSFGDSMLIL